MRIVRYSMVLDGCEYSVDQLVQSLSNSDPWVKNNLNLFSFRRGYFPKEMVILTDNYKNLEGLERAIQKLI